MDYNILPSSPSSSSSTSSSSSPSARGDGYAVTKTPNDEELRREGVDRVIQRLRHIENEHKKLLIERSRSMKDVNRKLQVHLLEVRGVREVNQRLMQEKEILLQEKEDLSGICCFLDDDREKAKKVAREWQMFGRYTTAFLQREIANWQTKVKDLEQRQLGLIQENRNLKELCLMLDQEQAGSRNSLNSHDSLPGPHSGLLTVAGTRDSGDGSSNGSTTSTCSPDQRQTAVPSSKENLYSSDPSQGESYLRYLEHKVRHLEEESKGRVKRVTVPPSQPYHHSTPPPPSDGFGSPGKLQRKFFSSSVLPTSSGASVAASQLPPRVPSMNHLSGSESNVSSNSMSPQKLETGVYASMKVLELRDQLEHEGSFASPDSSILDEKEKAMVREMCNVVWRKLGDKGKVRMANGKPVVPRTASVSNL